MSVEQEATIQTARIPSIGAIIRESRPGQIVKNGIVLVPLFFTVNIWYSGDDYAGMAAIVGRAFAALGVFILLSAAIYFINDSVDVKRDRAHPRKRSRPIASGAISIGWALGLATLMIAGGLIGAVAISIPLLLTATAYLATNVAYSLWIKNVVLLDVMAVAAGFVFRAVAGSIAIDRSVIERAGATIELDLTISPWLYVVTALGALFLALAKRRGELFTAGDNSTSQRAILAEYSVPFLDSLLNVVATATLIAYTLYTFSTGVTEANVPANNSMMLTIPFVAYGIMRYLYLIHEKSAGEAPEEILIRDWPLGINIFLWLITGSSVLMWSRIVS
ncbi:MAG: decaprenyl-phosphate phosphoribosyltransferase [Dehalococcoidia bacterium]|jgi:4-hydroxybenzoate polyprenyltransferase|nr:decaprenyl-phosphate phosphoribosyltransferase [Dehalococcoidia bacterium]